AGASFVQRPCRARRAAYADACACACVRARICARICAKPRTAGAGRVQGHAGGPPVFDDRHRRALARDRAAARQRRSRHARARDCVEELGRAARAERASGSAAPRVRGRPAKGLGDGRRNAGADHEHVAVGARASPRRVDRGFTRARGRGFTRAQRVCRGARARAVARACMRASHRRGRGERAERTDRCRHGQPCTEAVAPHRPRCYRVRVMLATFVEGTADFEKALARLEFRGESNFARVEPAVREILAAVSAEGDAAVQRYNERFGRRAPQLVAREYPGAAALDRLPADVRSAMELAASRVRAFHMHERDAGFRYEEAGISLGVRVRPVARAGVYAPGGKARYPSSVIMSAVPAQVAGVTEIVLATPLSGDASDDPIYAAAHLSGVAAIVDAGGAQAIAGLAYGTESIPRVAKIVGPGNLYVACAKRLVFGVVDIDGIAGPSEIIVVADDEADPRLIAADLLSQAEHDEAAYPLLVCSSDLMAGAVRRELELQLETLPKAAIARAALANGAAFVTYSRELMAAVADRLAGEHLALHVADPEAMLGNIHHAGAAFLGSMTP